MAKCEEFVLQVNATKEKLSRMSQLLVYALLVIEKPERYARPAAPGAQPDFFYRPKLFSELEDDTKKHGAARIFCFDNRSEPISVSINTLNTASNNEENIIDAARFLVTIQEKMVSILQGFDEKVKVLFENSSALKKKNPQKTKMVEEAIRDFKREYENYNILFKAFYERPDNKKIVEAANAFLKRIDQNLADQPRAPRY